ncbi:MAG: UvrD-helicase domain-containing protein [Eubacteriales bacterium]|nr:UvrD-helicase domain-containing protein [Eubacteriales bacterium]
MSLAVEKPDDIRQSDRAAREKIKHELDTSLFVEAGAGSGKTSVLVERMVNMVRAGRDISRICAITFTKAAANEFYARFKNALQKHAEKGDKLCEAALKYIDLCFMGTIDSFCSMILGEHPSEAGIPSNARIMEDAEMDALYRRKYKDILGGMHGEALKNKCMRFAGFYSDPGAVFAILMSMVMGRRNVHFNYTEPDERPLDEIFAEEKRLVSGIVGVLSRHEEAVSGKANDASRKAWETVQSDLHTLQSDWETNAISVSLALKSLGGLRLALEWDMSLLGAYAEAFETEPHRNKPAYHVLKAADYKKDNKGKDVPVRFTDITAKKIDNMKSAVSMDLIESCIPIVEAEFKNSGSLTFFDYLLYLRDMLKKDAEAGGLLIRHIYDRHSYFLIDEFQDTNPMQAEIFFYLAAKEPDPDWRRCVPYPGSLFIVGDPKQSIYRFRDADVGAFQRVKALFKGEVGEALLLSSNFRSTNEMCGWFNEVFKTLLPEDTGTQSRFPEIPIEEDKAAAGNFSGIYAYNVPLTAAAPEEKDQYRVLDAVKRLAGNPDYTISEIINGELCERQIRYSDFMIITPTKTGIPRITDLFIRNNIPFMVEGSTVFAESPAFAALTAVYDAAASPNDLGKVYKALICGLFGISRSEILEYRNNGGSLSVFADSVMEERTSKVSAALMRIRDLNLRSINMTPAALYEAILDEFEIFKYKGALNIEYVYYALELLRSGEASGGISSIEEAAAYLMSLLENKEGIERYLSLKQGTDRVHIANLHKVKGLEAEIVILASPNRKKRKPGQRVEQTGGTPEGWIFSVTKSVSGESNYTPLMSCTDFPEKEEAEEISQYEENIRLLYVAATRARRALIIARQVNKDGNPTAANAWLELLDHCSRDFFAEIKENANAPAPRETAAAEELYEKAGECVFESSLPGEKSYEIKLPSQIKLKSVLASEDDFEDAKEDEVRKSNIKRNPALIGTIVHRLMEVLVTSGNSIDLGKTIAEICSEYDALDAYYSDILKNVGDKIRGGGFKQGNGCPQDILGELLSADEVHCELPFCYKEPDRELIWNGVIDAMYKRDGSWHIIDYKTNLEADELDEKYKGQLDAYIKAFKAMTGETADAFIYHIEV